MLKKIIASLMAIVMITSLIPASVYAVESEMTLTEVGSCEEGEHQYGDWIITKAATCTKSGEMKRVCSVCGSTEVKQIATAEHIGIWQTMRKATCTDEGRKKMVCQNCGEEIIEAIAPIGHTFEDTVIKESTCTAEGSMLRTCTVCGTEITETITASGHTVSDWIVDKAATCIEVGSRHKECTACHTVLETEEIPLAEHTEEIIPAVEATCTKTGLTEGKKCSVCDKILVEQVTVPVKEHTSSDWIADKAATCIEVGSRHKECTACHAVLETEEIPLAEHTEEIIPAVEATCTKTGLTEGKKCSVCGKTLVEQEVTPAAGHKEVIIVGKPATCTEDGLTYGIECSVCGEKLQKQEIIPAAHIEEIIPSVEATCTKTGLTEGKICPVCGEILVKQEIVPIKEHTLSDWIVDKTATCTEVGSKHKECTVCHTVLETGEIPLADHTEETIPAVEATCTKTGLTEGKKCSVCGEILVEQAIVPVKEHTPSDWLTDKAATCTELGSKHKECTVCQTVLEAEEIPMIAHIEKIIPAVEATCTKTGLTEGKKCSVCGEILIEQEVVPVKEHTPSEWITDKAATCTELGSKHKECTVCQTVLETEEIPMIAHTEEIIPAVEATCTKAGLTEGKKCSVCGKVTVEQRIVPAKGHAESEWIIDKASTCIEVGSQHKECTVCHIVLKEEEIPLTEHTVVDAPAVEATCLNTGLTAGKKCSVCGKIFEGCEETPLADHNKSEWKIEVPATCNEVGRRYTECTVCHIRLSTEPISKTEHEFEKTVVEASCTNGGYTRYTCRNCGYSETEDLTFPKGHTKVTLNGKAATCTKDGLTNGIVCSVCGKVYEEQKIIKAKGHDYGSWKKTVKETYTSNGTRVRSCKVCGAEQKETIGKLKTTSITKCSISAAKTAAYTGKAIAAKVTVKNGKTTLKAGTHYTVSYKNNVKIGKASITIKGVEKNGYSGSKTLTFNIVPGVTKSLKVASSTSSVKLTWSKVTGATGYRVYRHNGKNWDKIADIKGTTYTVKKLKSGTVYKYAVRTYTTVGKTVYWSATYAQLSTATKPATPSVKVTAGKKQAAVSWKKVTGASGYVVYYSTSKDGKYKKLATVKSTSYTAKKLTSGKTYYFKVAAYKTVNKSNIYGGYSSPAAVKVK